MKTSLLAASAVLIGTLLSGCGPGYAVVGYGPPPPPRYGAMGYAPGPGYVWADGYYDRVGGRWAWRNGRWMRPPRGRSAWIHPEWREERGHWRYHRGYWR